MKHFAVHDIATGALRRRGSCMAADFALQAGDGEVVIEADAGRRDSCVADAARSPAIQPARPDPGARR